MAYSAKVSCGAVIPDSSSDSSGRFTTQRFAGAASRQRRTPQQIDSVVTSGCSTRFVVPSRSAGPRDSPRHWTVSVSCQALAQTRRRLRRAGRQLLGRASAFPVALLDAGHALGPPTTPRRRNSAYCPYNKPSRNRLRAKNQNMLIVKNFYLHTT